MDETASISVWIQQLKQGEADAAQKLWERYYRRLVGLARKKLQDAPRRAQDEEDVVQSAFKSFCLRAEAGQFPDLRDRENLWPLLVLITARKAANQRKRERTAKRGGGRVRTASAPEDSSDAEEFAQFIAQQPTPEDAVVFFTELERIMDSLDNPTLRLILLWKLEERTNAEIARHLDSSLSSVERKLRLIRESLAALLTEGVASSR
jgi:RNA polymerase sigma factor (sigma-70 family)